MATLWQLETVEIFRGLIFDLSETPDFTDSELLRLLVIAAHYVNRETDFVNDYSIDISKQLIDPDPSDDDTKDPDFLNFVCLKAACMLNIGQTRINIAAGFLVKDDKNTLDLQPVAQNSLTLMQEGYCKVYDKLMREYKFNNTGEAASAILSPFRTILGSPRRITFYKA